MRALLFVSFFLCFLVSCAGTVPFLEYSIAQKAIQSARKANASTMAPVYWMKALEYYKKAEQNFQERNYTSAGHLFGESIRWSEKAENFSRLKTSLGEGS